MSGAIFSNDVGAIVVDIGSHSTKAGWGGQDRPEIDIPTVLGHRAQKKFNFADVKYPNYLCGVNHVNAQIEEMEIVSPIKNGAVIDWTAFEALLNHVFSYELRILPDEHPVMLVELPLTQGTHRETISEIMFEKFCVSGFYSANPAVLATFSHCKSSGLVIDAGHTLTSIVPVVDGFALKRNSFHLPLAGGFLAEKSRQLLKKLNIDMTPRYLISKKEITQENQLPIFSKRTQPQSDYSYHLTPMYYEFPNGYYGRFEDERYIIPEQLFNPNSHEDPTLSSLELHKLILKCIILNNIITVGGTSTLTGYSERIQHSISNALPPNFKHRFISTSYPSDRRFCAWTGGSILSSMGTFHQNWVSKTEYMEVGKRIIDLKCQ
ncbi:Actin-like protein 6A [Thelohanellus kitauei]|uniref:Actin-like protein 6A n=1 Tax=Thelohanellus kitauei TaxID=669202 RepID=A0A0C2MK97_THEKT|nr:Actin-like protein 6A [Thelohanellus kitauei]